MEKETMRRLVPWPVYDVTGTESWLEEMAKKGWLLAYDGIFAGVATFERAEPRPVRYRLQPAQRPVSIWSDDGTAPDDEVRALGEACGWQYVAVRGQFHIYRCDDPDAPELNTDPQVLALALDTVRRRERSAALTTLLWVVIFPLVRWGGGLLLLFLGLGTWRAAWGVALLILGTVRAVRKLLYLRRLRKQLAAGQMPERGPYTHRHAYRAQAVSALVVVLWVAWGVVLLQAWSDAATDRYVQPLAGQADALPFATMADFVPGSTLQQRDDGILNNTLYQRSDLLAPVICEVHEHGTLTLPDGRKLSGGLQLQYYELRSEALARLLMHELHWHDRRSSGYELWKLGPVDADEVLYYRDYLPTVLLRQGSRVVRACFYQSTDDTALEPQVWIGALADSLR